jgi:hypothetical protein
LVWKGRTTWVACIRKGGGAALQALTDPRD